MKTSIRLVTKLRLSIGMSILFICLVAGAASMMVADDAKEMTAKFELLSLGFTLSFVGVIISFAFGVKYVAQRRDAWRDYVRGWGVPTHSLLEKMQGAPSGKEVYTDREASVLADTFADSGRYLSPGLLGDFQMLQERGWIYLTFAEKGREEVVARPTDQAWAAVDELRPRDWSPEEFESSRLASCID